MKCGVDVVELGVTSKVVAGGQAMEFSGGFVEFVDCCEENWEGGRG